MQEQFTMQELGKRMTNPDIIKTLRGALVPQGTLPVVKLDWLSTGEKYFNKDFVDKCLDEIERLPLKVAMGEEITHLERLALALMCSAAAGFEPRKPENKL